VARFGVPLETLGVERLLAAAVAMAVLEGRADARPVPLGRTVELGQRLFEGTPEEPRLRPSAADRAFAGLEAAVPPEARDELRRLVGLTLTRLLDELGTAWLQEGRLDPIATAVLPMESSPVP
jgi:AcrR family transcriptional regulator